MAQNEVQRYETELAFHNAIRNPISQFYDIDHKMKRLLNHLEKADSSDYPTSPLVALNDLRVAMAAYFASTEYTALMTEIEDFIRI